MTKNEEMFVTRTAKGGAVRKNEVEALALDALLGLLGTAAVTVVGNKTVPGRYFLFSCHDCSLCAEQDHGTMKLLSRRVFLSYDYSPTDRFPIWPRRLYRTELPGILFCR